VVLSCIRSLLGIGRDARDARAGRSAAARERREALETLHLRQLDLLQRVRIETVEAMAARRRLEARVQALEEAADRAATEARVSANVESDDSVRDLLRQEAAARERAVGLGPVLERFREQEAVLSAAVTRLASKVDAFADRKAALLARASAAEATDRVAAEAREFHELTASIDGALRTIRTAADTEP
jgi:phage shock protein A